eukprot:XP_001694658.1 ZIP family transporter [Chlamydomonas reinhardtii]
MPLKLEDAVWPLALATMAGLSTSIGAVVAAMAALLGLALGVMACVSIVELVLRNAMSGESDPLLILAAAGAGSLAYYVAEPFFPKMDEGHDHLAKPRSASGHGGELGGGGAHTHAAQSESQRIKAGRMMRLGLLMAVTMTVAFSAFTDFGPVMALAIALHNIPEGVIIAAPIYAATGSRWKAIGLATASGLSEPLGALLSLLLLQPFFTQERLHYLLAFTGGVMLAVCGIELWPEGRNCRHDRAFAAGILGGVAVMGWTLLVEG